MTVHGKKTKKVVLVGLFIAIGIVLPFITMQIPSIGNILLPMHIPVILCGFICGGPYGLIVGVIVPLLRSILFGMPELFPNGIAMAFELGTYGLVTGVLYKRFNKKAFGIYLSLICSMIVGRIVWGVVSIGLYSMLGNTFTWKIFLMQGFLNAIPGIIIQLILIPMIAYKLEKAKVMRSILEDDNLLLMKEGCERRFEAALKEVDRLLEQSDKEVLLVVIDGKCGSGKTTLGYYMQKVYDCNLFHMDDFFLQNDQRTPERLSEVGGNVDYERFNGEVLIPIIKGLDVEYRPFNCQKRVIQEESIIKHKRLNIIEGSYSMHPYFGDVYDVGIFMDIDDQQQINNIRKRNGEEKLMQFKKEWIPKENAYFEKFDISSGCIVIEWSFI